MTFTHALATNNYGTAKFIVDASAANGTHTTIAAALTSASSGDTISIRPGTYTENITLKAGVNLAAYNCDALTPNVIILGKATFTSAGTVTISGIQLKTNSDFCLAVTGSAASIVNLQDCYINANNNTAISFTVSNSSAKINLYNCNGDTGTTGITYIVSTSTGTTTFYYCNLMNTGASTTASSSSAAPLVFNYTVIYLPITSTSTGGVSGNFSEVNSAVQNVAAIVMAGSGGNNWNNGKISSGSAVAVTATSATSTLYNCYVNSTNASVINGAGTITYADLTFSGTANSITTTTQTILPSTPFQNVVIQTFTSTGTYTPTAGMKYCQIEVVGSGAGGGGTEATGATTFASGSGGSAGGYARGVFSAATIGASQAVTVGNAGAGGVGNNPGGNGNTVSVGALISATGGTGGNAGSALTVGTIGASGASGAGTGGNIQISGQLGSGSFVDSTLGFGIAGGGGSSPLGFGGGNTTINSGTASTGVAATGYGAGGGGGGLGNSKSAGNGGTGTKGIVIVTEYV